MYKIYKITNKVNGKVYIGQTVKKITTRLKEHFNYKGDTYFSRAIKKYGRESFIVDLIVECSESEVNDLERYWISFFQSNNSTFGYNSTSGGQSRFKLTEDLRQQRIAHFKKIARRTPVIGRNVATGEEIYFSSISEVTQVLGFKEPRIFAALKRKDRLYKGYYWRKAQEPFVQPPPRIYSQEKAIIAVKEDKIYFYTNLKKVELDGFTRDKAGKACKTGKLYKGFRWKYLKDALIQHWTGKQ